MTRSHWRNPVRLLALGLLLITALGISGCVSLSQTVNISKQAGLTQVNRLEIAERVGEPAASYEQRLTITDPDLIEPLIAALDADLQLEPLVDCLAQYQLNFVLAEGQVQTMDYYCAGGESFLTGAQSFWTQQQVTPPAAFDKLMRELLQKGGE